MTQAPTFNLSANNIDFTDEELQAELSKSNSKYFDTPGVYDLTITTAVYHENKETKSIYCKGDSTWLNVKLTLADNDGKTIDHWLQVPTAGVTYGPKQTLLVFRKFQEFMYAIGETVEVKTLNKLAEKYFGNLSKLVGQKVTATLGYERDYVTKQGDGYVVIVKGKPFQEDSNDVVMPDRSSAIQYAKSQGIEPGFIRVLKFAAKKLSLAKKAVNSEW